MTSRLASVKRIVRQEGIAGLIGRLRHRRLIPANKVPPAPALPDQLALLDHGHPDLTALLFRFLESVGVTPRPSRVTPQDTALHIGWPSDPDDIRRGDMLLSVGTNSAGPSLLPRLSLILESDPARLTQLSTRPTGHPHVIALPDLSQGSDAGASRLSGTCHFALQRVAVFCGRLDSAMIDYSDPIRAALVTPRSARICLSIPELPDRRAAFQSRELDGFVFVDGLKRQPGWRGAASSYRALARAALGLGLSELTVVQDDVQPGPDFAARLAVAEEYFRRSGADMFNGLATDVDDSFQVTRFQEYRGMRFLHLNKSVGLVFNIFGPRALQRLAEWQDEGGTVETNTIDRYLSRTSDLQTVTTLPALVGHDPKLQSAIWSFRNARYDALIEASQKRLATLARMRQTPQR